jgi:hypothetical protein
MLCSEAAEAILALAESHATMFGADRAPAFLGLFVQAAAATREQLRGLAVNEVKGAARSTGLGSGLGSAGITMAAVEKAIGAEALSGLSGDGDVAMAGDGITPGLGIGGSLDDYLLP